MEQSIDRQSIFKMSLPIFIEIFLQILVGNIDQLMLSQHSQIAVAAVGNANQILNIIIICMSMMAVATTILITQYLGAKNYENISSVFTVSLLISGVFGLFATVFLLFGAHAMFVWLNVPSKVMPDAESFLRIVALGTTIQALYFTFVSCFRGFSLMKITMVISIIINILNIAGNLLLINGFWLVPSLGAQGAAISTVISRILGLIFIYVLFKKFLKVEISLKYVHPFPLPMLKKILSISIPTSTEALSYQLSQTTIMKMVNIFGVAVITTKIYAYIIATFTFIYTLALSTALQIVVGFLAGAGRFDEAQKRVWDTLKIALILGPGLTTIVYLFSDRIFGLFTDNPDVITLGKTILFIEIFLEIGRTVNIVLIKSLQASGDIKVPVVVGISSMWSVAVGGSYLLAIVNELGLVGIWIAMATDECLRAAIFVWRWRSGRWKNKKLQISN